LREPLSSLARADAIVAAKDFPVEKLPKGNFDIWRAERLLEIPDLTAPVIAFCGIARPQRFFAELRRQNLDLREEIVFRDHHRYTDVDLQHLAAAQGRFPGSRLVTTEKDAINLGQRLAKLNPVVIPMRIRLSDSDAALKHLLGTIAERRRYP